MALSAYSDKHMGKHMGKQRAQGWTMMGVLITLVIAGIIGAPILRAIPTFIEYQSVKRAANWAKQNGSSPKEARAAFDKQAQLDRFDVVTANDLEIEEQGNVITAVRFQYRKEVEFFGPISFLITYSGEAR